jgi:hypothetical protein
VEGSDEEDWMGKYETSKEDERCEAMYVKGEGRYATP